MVSCNKRMQKIKILIHNFLKRNSSTDIKFHRQSVFDSEQPKSFFELTKIYFTLDFDAYLFICARRWRMSTYPLSGRGMAYTYTQSKLTFGTMLEIEFSVALLSVLRKALWITIRIWKIEIEMIFSKTCYTFVICCKIFDIWSKLWNFTLFFLVSRFATSNNPDPFFKKVFNRA